jgi:hypothetical protein
MVLVHTGLDQSAYSLTLTFDDSDESFIHFERIFRTLASIEQDYRYFVLRHEEEHVRKRLTRRQAPGSVVRYISKNSPLEIGAIIANPWFELFLFALGIKFDFIGYARGSFNNFEAFVDLVEGKLRELTDDFPEYERESLREIWIWFMAMSQDQQIRFVQRVHRYGRILRDLRKIQFRRS